MRKILLISTIFAVIISVSCSKFVETGIERVIDGDTVVINGESCRLLDINAPELDTYEGIVAKEYLELRLRGKDIDVYYHTSKDIYGRRLVGIFIDEEYINKTMIEEGYAEEY